jgi:hypothetical protein
MDERRVRERYLSMPLSELEQRSNALHAQQVNGRITGGQRTYRRRLKRALEMRRGMRDYAVERGNASRKQVKLTAEQRYDQSYDEGKRDALARRPSRGTEITDETEQDGYRHGYWDHYYGKEGNE